MTNPAPLLAGNRKREAHLAQLSVVQRSGSNKLNEIASRLLRVKIDVGLERVEVGVAEVMQITAATEVLEQVLAGSASPLTLKRTPWWCRTIGTR